VKDLLLRASVVVRTSNMKISRRRLADYVKTLHQKACGTCSMIIFLHSTNQIIDLWRCRWRCRRQILNSLFALSGQTVKNFHWLACKFDIDQSDRKSSQLNASACKAWPNGVASRPEVSTYDHLRVRLTRA